MILGFTRTYRNRAITTLEFRTTSNFARLAAQGSDKKFRESRRVASSQSTSAVLLMLTLVAHA